MGERLIKPYEISVWEDKLTQYGEDDYRFEENKLAVIGSDTMTGLNKVYNPVFNKKTNGERTLTFSLKYKFFNPYTGTTDYVNPFADLLTNERKVKLHYDNEWYEFIIKDHTESSEDFTWTYTCTDAFVLELSKNGYNLTFDSELNNNQGTAAELAEATLENTDWKWGGSDTFKQLVVEPIYKATLVSTTGITIVNTGNTDETIEAGSAIYLFYSYVKNQSGKFIQFIIRDNNRQYTIDDKNVITDTNFRITTELTYKEDGFYNGNNKIISWTTVENLYQANRLVYNQLTTYDPVMGRTVDRFDFEDTEVYRYTDYEYTTSNIVMNYITNGENFNSLEDGTLQGWNPYTDQELGSNNQPKPVNKLELVTYPELATGKPLADLNTLSQVEGFLKVKFNGSGGTSSGGKYYNTVYNSGFENNASFIQSISKGDKFVFRWRAGKGELGQLQPVKTLGLIVARYEQDAPTRFGQYYKHIKEEDVIMHFVGQPRSATLPTANNIIEGGTIVTETLDNQTTIQNYVIDGVVQTPSTKYIYKSDNNSYVWNGLTSTFDALTNNNYLPYYYLVAEARESIANTVITDSTVRIGLFIYTTEVETTTITDAETHEQVTTINPIYIQDIQLTRFIQDTTYNIEYPILIGNIPTATSQPIEYYYLKPEDGAAAESIETYISIDKLADRLGVSSNSIVPKYNESSEKTLSINASQSNCFNILQTIAETFECWVDLVVEHDENGYITQDNEGNLNKFIYLREYIGDESWAGFRYGINLQSIERDINSDEIVTKLIVDQSQSDYVDKGFVSIASAPSNTSGESYILNFDYYYNQNLLNREEVEKDKNNFIVSIADLNRDLQKQEKIRIDLEASLTSLGSKRNVYTELVNSAEDTITETLEEFERLTGQSYDDYRAEHEVLITPTESEETNETNKNQQLTEEETILEVLGKLYACSSTINNYSGLLTNIEQEYWNIRKQLRGSEDYSVRFWKLQDALDECHVIVDFSDYLVGAGFTIGENDYQVTISKKYFDIVNNSANLTIEFSLPDGYSVELAQYTIDESPQTVEITATQEIPGVEDEIERLQAKKDELTNQFNNKYRRFIQEGTWNSTEYIDSELYYLDAVQVSNTSAQPQISYTINVVEISQLEGFEWYKFDAGDKTYVEDTDYFGWSNVDGILTPAREEVIVSEVEWHLDDPSENVITVQNYKTRFEDLFQRISATVQTVQYNEATYAKISTLLDADGTINQNVLLESLNRISGEKYNLTSDGSILIDGDQITVRNLTNAANLVIINSEGIRVSSDGGNHWQTAIDGYGINAGAVYTGELNTENIIIGSRTNPSFRWDKSGISAYRSKVDGTYDLQTYVRYDEYGLYGIKNNVFKADSLQDVLDKAHFAVTWDGFFIKNSYAGGGRVEITSDNDFRVLKTVDNEEKEVIKIGALEWGDSIIPVDNIAPTLYGIRITNDEGVETFKTGTDGNIEITGIIHASGGDFNTVINVGPTDQNHIIIDGTTGPNSPSISSSTYSDGAGTGWIINKDGDAVFNNITARGAIKTAVFEYAEIQAVGGMFIFRPSSTIKSARIDGNDLIVTVDKPLLFEKVSYNQKTNFNAGDNPKALGLYERATYGGYKLTEHTSVNAETEYFIKSELSTGGWCKISNYTYDGIATDPTIQNVLQNNGLTHVYRVSNINSLNKEITLENAAKPPEDNEQKSFVYAIKQENQTIDDVLASLEGGALIDMGHENGLSNYGIGINSSDNTVNLPARAISLFETIINRNNNILRVSYDYRGVLGTLPVLEYSGESPKVNEIYHNNLEGTQGIYTDNMYIGNSDQYITFYSSWDNRNDKHLRINTKELTLKAGTFSARAVDNKQNFVYLSSEDYAKDVVNGIAINNSDTKADWRLIVGNKFGVDKAGNLYASNATIEGHIQATSGSFGSIQYDGTNTTIPEGAITGLTDKLNTISNEASLKGYTLHVETIYPDYPSDDIDEPDYVILTAHIYYANRDITTSCDPNLFIWQLKNEEQIETLTPNVEGNPYSVKYNRNLAGYGTTIICNFAIDEEVLLTTPDHFALETPDGFLLTARV